MNSEKTINWLGTTYQDILNFPIEARKEAGYQLSKVQNGIEPDDWKPLNQIGAEINEIRIWESSGTYRVIYIAKFKEEIHILHCFQKKTEKITKTDKDIIKARYRAIKSLL